MTRAPGSALVRVVAPHFVAGLVMSGEHCAEAAPILRWAVGKRRWRAARILRPQGLGGNDSERRGRGGGMMDNGDPGATELLEGVLSDGDQNRSLTTEDYARLAQVNPETFEDEMAERFAELSADQACALFDLAAQGRRLEELRAHEDFGEWVVGLQGTLRHGGELGGELLRILRGEP